MSELDQQSHSAPRQRKQTPRVPSNVLYNKLVPIAIGLMVVVLAVVLLVVLAGLLSPVY